MHRILINKELCMGCKSCVLACMLKHSKAKNMYLLDLESIDAESMGHIEPVSYTHLDVYKRQAISIAQCNKSK